MPGCPTLIPRFDGTRFAGQFVSGVSLHGHTGNNEVLQLGAVLGIAVISGGTGPGAKPTRC